MLSLRPSPRLLVILGSASIAAVIRFSAVSGVLPHVHHADEPTVERAIFQVARKPTESPEFFNYPSLLFYVQAAVLRTYEAFTGGQARPLHKLARGVTRTSHPGWWLAARSVTVLVGSALAALSAALAIRLAGNPLAGLPAGLWAATCPSLVFDSTLLTPDTYAAFFAMLALWLAAHLASGAALGTYVAAGVAVGLAAGSKYTALLAALSLVVAHFLREGVRGFVKPGIWLSGLASALAFLCSTPFALLDRHEFWKDLTFEWAHYTQGHAGVRGSSLSYYTNLIVDEVGIKLLFAPLCLLVASRSSKTAAAAVGAFSLCYFAFISRTEVHFGRNAVPLFAPLLALSSAGLWAGATRFVTRENVRTAAIAALTILTGIKPAHAAYESVVAHHDNLRAPAEKWIDDNLPPGSVVLIESYGPWVDPHKFRVVGVDDFGHTNQKQLWRDGVRYVVVSQQYYRRYLNDPKKYPREFKRYEWLLSRRCVLFDSRVPYREIQVVDTQCEPP